ncbi:hypothetical protein SAMN05216561_1165 [Nocardioides psychrotolerans]|uniref:Uncharacterized protein n=1 Tax=Nocardioides psychrotolerans TaxID=1005945 RepID=A0A1I3MQS5_9ACTN|nr:hypothetical protein SAMN05216561_1165 [Nocardioides psychrotolerans]
MRVTRKGAQRLSQLALELDDTLSRSIRDALIAEVHNSPSRREEIGSSRLKGASHLVRGAFAGCFVFPINLDCHPQVAFALNGEI